MPPPPSMMTMISTVDEMMDNDEDGALKMDDEDDGSNGEDAKDDPYCSVLVNSNTCVEMDADSAVQARISLAYHCPVQTCQWILGHCRWA